MRVSYTIETRQNRKKVVRQLRLSIKFYQKNLLKKSFERYRKSCKNIQVIYMMIQFF